MGVPFVLIGKRLRLTLLLTKLLVWAMLLHTLEIFWQHGFTTFFLGKNKKKCAKMWGAFFPVSGVHSSLQLYLEIELVKFILLFRGLCLMFCYSAD